MMGKAQKESQAIIEKAKELADVKKGEMIEKARAEIGQVINDERKKMDNDKEKTLREIRKEVSEIVVVSLKKILGEHFDKEKDADLIEKALKKIK